MLWVFVVAGLVVGVVILGVARVKVRQSKFLVDEVYYSLFPSGGGRGHRSRLEANLRALSVPSVPGVYLDREGVPWTLHADGTWEDHKGERRSVAWSRVMGINGPWSKPE